ncbi:MAG: DUF4038 domain-containing protein [Clostridiales bacterium]|jgi:hypothetical protein|nr:DUF4038 domain-containing protein [Clostridiales bacterium]
MRQIELHGVFEETFTGIKSSATPGFEAVFTNKTQSFTVPSFWDGEGRYAIRFMPQTEGEWSYTAAIDGKELSGNFLCIPSKAHGLVKAVGEGFQYEDGTRYLPFGTTCYAWTHQTQELEEQTLATLRISPFNKVRMCVFPKSMPYNNNEPELFPYAKKEDGSWDIDRPDPEFWKHLEKRISDLQTLGVEADLILLHPYDRWGFSKLSPEEDVKYLKYCVARLSAYSNVWWSLANEYDFVASKTLEDWDCYGETVSKADIYGHLTSVHNGFVKYPKRYWTTHRSIQSGDVRKVNLWKDEYHLPVIVDECGYEGDIEYSWGNLSAFEMVNRIWTVVTRGGYCTHGETFHREDEVLWWAKGGALRGESPERIAFLRNLLQSIPESLETAKKNAFSIDPNDKDSKALEENPFAKSLMSLPEHERNDFLSQFMPNMISSGSYSLNYLGRECRSIMDLKLPENGKYKIELIDAWEMTRTALHDSVSGNIKLRLPGKEGIAILVTRLEGEGLN